MIVRETNKAFIMIEQHEHARVAANIMTDLKPHLLKRDNFWNSVIYAIEQHDCGWKPFDKEPFWNDKKHAPYTFIDFPLLPKLTLYKQGIDKVEQVNPYAALLCSEHYARFVKHHKIDEVKYFLEQERKRHERIIKTFPHFNQTLFDLHYNLLQFGDNLSLYICLNEPGVSKNQEHSFFREGIPIPTLMQDMAEKRIQVEWKNERTIYLDMFPFIRPIPVTFQQKVVSKEDITTHGLLESYSSTAFEKVKIQLQSV